MFFPPVLLLFIWNKLKKKDTKQKPTMIQQRNLTYTITVWYIHYLYIVYLLTVKKKTTKWSCHWSNSRRAVANHHCLDRLATCRVWMEQWSTWETKPRSHYQPLWDSPCCKVDVEKKCWMAGPHHEVGLTPKIYERFLFALRWFFEALLFWTTAHLSLGWHVTYSCARSPTCLGDSFGWLEMGVTSWGRPKPNGSQPENHQHEFAKS